MSTYTIVKSTPNNLPSKDLNNLVLNWNAPQWQGIPSLQITNFRPESSGHQPLTELKLQYTSEGIFGLFRAQDNYVQCQQRQFQDMVCKDACVEMFIQPNAEEVPNGQPHASYMNLEISGNSTKLCYGINDSTRADDGFVNFTKLTPEEGQQILTKSTLPEYVYPEITTPIEWCAGFYLPFTIIEKYTGLSLTTDKPLSGSNWRMNAFKCTEDSSHPHWASWQKCSAFNFHQPKDFGHLVFE